MHMACNFNCLFENGGHFKVTGSHVHCKCVSISETVPGNSRCYYSTLIGIDMSYGLLVSVNSDDLE